MAWPDFVSILSIVVQAIGPVGGTLGIVLAILKVREYLAGRPRAIAAHLAPRLRELRRMLLESNIYEAMRRWEQEFVMKGYTNDLARIGSELANEMSLLSDMLNDRVFQLPGLFPDSTLFFYTLGPTSRTPGEISAPSHVADWLAASGAFKMDEGTRTKVLRLIVDQAVAQIDKVLEKAEGA